MHVAEKARGEASTETPPRPVHPIGRVNRYARSRLASEVLTRAAMSRAYRADRAEELERSARPSAYCWLSFGLVVLASACLVAAAASGEAWLLAIAVGLALLAAALGSCA
jgi:hypothetical protein